MKLLAFDTSTEIMSIAVAHDAQLWQHTGAGGAQASSTLIPAIQALMAQAGLRLEQLDAIVFGRGPGSFTGLRTACSVAQGLAFGAAQAAGAGASSDVKVCPSTPCWPSRKRPATCTAPRRVRGAAGCPHGRDLPCRL